MTRSDPSSGERPQLDALPLDRLPAGRSVGLADPQQPDAPLSADELVLGVGLTPAGAASLLRAAAVARVAAVVLDRPGGAADQALVGLADELAVRLSWRPAALSWRELHRQLSERSALPPVGGDDELADLAQTIATLTGGLVTIEDTSARVLAYSRSSDEVDELRRLSILGRSGPPAYLALLREWGVYDRLAGSEEVVEIAEHPQSGVRRRLAVGVFAGSRQLGTIWLQQGATDFEPHARRALLGAARLAAEQLADQGRRNRQPAGGSLAELLSGEASGRSPSPAGGSDLPAGSAAARPCAVAVFAPSAAGPDAAADRLRLAELSAIVTVHGVAFRRRAVTGQLAGRVYLLLPNLDTVARASPMLADAVTAIRRHADPGARAAIGTLVESVAVAARSRQAADLALSAPGADPVVSFDTVRSRLITRAVEDALCSQPELLDARYRALLADDPDLARTLLAYLDFGSDVVRVAGELGVHPTTVRHRLRRAVTGLGIDLADAEDRLAAQLQLRCGLRSRAKAR